MISFSVHMAPMGKARPRLSGRRVHMPAAYVKWKKDFGALARIGWGHAPAITEPFDIAIAIITKSGKMRSDIDNSAGSILDAMQDAGLIGNDRDCRSLSITLRNGAGTVIAVTIQELPT